MNFADKLIEHLEKNGLLQSDVCGLLDLSPQFVSQIVKGHKVPGLLRLEDWAEFLDISHAHCIRLVLQTYLDRDGIKATVASVRKP